MDDVINTFDSLLRPRHVLDFTLKPEQAKCIDAVLRAKDVIAVLPTGFGKSACYYVPPLILDEVCLILRFNITPMAHSGGGGVVELC